MEEDIIARLLATSAVTDICGSRIYPGARPQASTLPAVVLQHISGGPTYTDDGETGLAEVRIQLDFWADTYSAAKLLARAVKGSLSAFVGTVGSTTFEYILVEDERDFREGGSNSEAYEFRTNIDCRVWYRN